MDRENRTATMHSDFSLLSPREHQLLSMAAAGLSDKQVAIEMGVSVHTLRTYWDRISEKLGAGNKTSFAAAYAAYEVSRLSPGSNLIGLSGLTINLRDLTVRASDDVNEEHGFQHGSVHKLSEYKSLIHPEDSNAVMDVLNDVAVGRVEVAHVVCRCLALGKETVVSYMLHPLRDDEGVTTGICGYRTEQRDVRSGSLGRVRVGFFERWSDSDELTVDEEFRLIFGLPEDKEVRRHTVFSSIHPEDRQELGQLIEKVDASPGLRQAAEFRIRHRDGNEVEAKVVVRSVQGDKDRMKFVGTVTAVFA